MDMEDSSGVWQALFKNLPGIIGEAAQSGLGIVALVVLTLGIIAVIFFWRDDWKLRFGVFTMLLVVFVGFGSAAVYREASNEIPLIPPSQECPRNLPASEYDKCIEHQKQSR